MVLKTKLTDIKSKYISREKFYVELREVGAFWTFHLIPPKKNT